MIHSYIIDAQSGDEVAFQFVHLYSHPIIQKFLRNKWSKITDVDIEIIAEKALNEVWKSLPQFDNTQPFQPWLLTIVNRVASHYFRNNAIVYSLSQQDEETIADESSSTPEEIYLRSEVLKTVHRTLAMLKENRREVLILRFFFEFDYDQIVKTLSLPSVEAARQLCFNALRECREILDRQRNKKIHVNSDIKA